MDRWIFILFSYSDSDKYDSELVLLIWKKMNERRYISLSYPEVSMIVIIEMQRSERFWSEARERTQKSGSMIFTISFDDQVEFNYWTNPLFFEQIIRNWEFPRQSQIQRESKYLLYERAS